MPQIKISKNDDGEIIIKLEITVNINGIPNNLENIKNITDQIGTEKIRTLEPLIPNFTGPSELINFSDE